MAALKDWVTAADGEQFSRLPEGVVSVNISHSNITARMIELKFDLSQTVRTRTERPPYRPVPLPTDRSPCFYSACLLICSCLGWLVCLLVGLLVGLLAGLLVCLWALLPCRRAGVRHDTAP